MTVSVAGEVGGPLPGTGALTLDGDLGRAMVDGIHRYLDREYATLPGRRASRWTAALEAARVRLGSGTGAGADGGLLAWGLEVAATNRVRLRERLGVVDTREPVRMRFVAKVRPEVDPSANSAEVGRGPGYRVFAVAWTVFRGVEGEGLLLVPDDRPKADVLAIPDCDWAPEQLVGLAPGVREDWQYARRLAEHGCRVLVPALIGRGSGFAGNPGVRAVKHSQRETLWRASYEMGRTLAGYEVQMVLAGVDWLVATRRGRAEPDDVEGWLKLRARAPEGRQSLGMVGYGEGGLVALYAAALDPRIRSTVVSGYFGPRERLPDEPIYRNAWSLLREFGDAEVARLILPRALRVECGKYPEAVHTDEQGGAPGRLGRPVCADVRAETERAGWGDARAEFFEAGEDVVGDWRVLNGLCRDLGAGPELAPALGAAPRGTGPLPDAAERERRQYVEVLEDTQHLMRESEYTRREFWKRADVRSAAGFTSSAGWYRDYFRREVVGEIPGATLPPLPRTRLLYETNGVRGYEVVLDVHADVFAYGILVVPAGLGAGERRPVVVCQHGLEGRPTDVADPRVEHGAYHRFAYRLAERGFVTFAPQNPYLGGTRFRQILRKSQPLGLTLWSFVVRQHEAIADWLAAQPFVDPRRIGFYGLSYGGKTAMRVPVLVERYCLSICSADYNEWIWKNVSARAPYSYLWTPEYDMPEWNLGPTFNYAELSWLILPRPFMVERGHEDGVAPDEWVAYEFAKTRRMYDRLGLGDRAEIEFFSGPHTIHGVGTFAFLHRHLEWPAASAER